MQVRQLLTRTTLVAALLSAYAIADPARAGVLGGPGGAAGGSNFGVAGGASGGITRQGTLPRPEKQAVDAARQSTDRAADKVDATQDRARDNTNAATAAALHRATSHAVRSGVAGSAHAAGQVGAAGGAVGQGAGATGAAAGYATNEAALPRPDRKVVQTADDVADQAGAKAEVLQRQERDRAKAAVSTAHQKSHATKNQASGSAAAGASAGGQSGAGNHRTAHGVDAVASMQTPAPREGGSANVAAATRVKSQR